jgi:hypothetical protein
MRRRDVLRRVGLVASAVLVRPALAAQVPRIVGTLDDLHPVNGAHAFGHSLTLWLLGTGEHWSGQTWFDLVRGQRAVLTNMAFPATPTSGRGPTTRRGGMTEVRFNGTTGYADLGTGTHDYPNATFVVMCWFRATTAGYLINKRVLTPNGSNGGWFLRVDAGGTVTARVVNIDDTSAGSRTSTTTTLLDGAWHHALVVVTTDTVTLANNDVTLYVDGLLDQGARTDSAAGGYSVSIDPLTLGTTSDHDATSFLTGALDDVRIMAGSLTARQAWQLYQHSRLGAPGLLGDLPRPSAAQVPSAAPIRIRVRTF